MSIVKKKLGDIVSISKGKKHLPDENGKNRYINIEQLHSPEESHYTNESGLFVEENDLIIAWDGANAGKVGTGLQGVIGSTLARLRIIDNSTSSRYLFWYLDSVNDLIKSQRTGATIPHINGSSLKELEIPLPPLATQKRIAEILDAADALRRKDQELLKKYDELAQAIFIDMFGDPETNHKKWTIKPLSEICIKITDGTHHTPMYVSSGIPFLRVTDITESNMSRKYITEEEHLELIKRCKPEKGDVLYTKNGTIGVAKAIDWDFEFSIFVSLCLLKINKDLVLPEFLEAYLNTPIALKQAKKHSKTGTITNLHLIEIKQILSPVPPISNQKEYLELIYKIKSSINKVNGNHDLLFNSLLQQAFKGELVA